MTKFSSARHSEVICLAYMLWPQRRTAGARLRAAARAHEETAPCPPILRPSGRPSRRFAALALSSAAAIGLLAGVNLTHPGMAAPAPAPATAAPWAGYADLIEQVMPSVVAITAKRDASNQPAAGEPGWREFRFGEEDPDSDMMRRFMERFFGRADAALRDAAAAWRAELRADRDGLRLHRRATTA